MRWRNEELWLSEGTSWAFQVDAKNRRHTVPLPDELEDSGRVVGKIDVATRLICRGYTELGFY